jgi:Right handed beta helix region
MFRERNLHHRLWMGILNNYVKYFVAGLVLALIFSTRVLGAQKPIEAEGVITSDTTWSGDVTVFSDVLVPEGVTLTIAPGTTVLFAYSDSSKIEPMFLSMGTELLVRGRLVVEGRKDSPVTFAPAPEDVDLKKPERGDWGGLIFDGEAASASVVKFARFSMADSAVSTFYSSPEITGCTVDDSAYGFSCMGPSRPRIDGCVVRNSEFGILESHGAKPDVRDCKFEDNEQDYIVKEGP